MSDLGSGIDELNQRRSGRRHRQAPQPRHPKVSTAAAPAVVTVDEPALPAEPEPRPVAAAPAPKPVAAPPPPPAAVAPAPAPATTTEAPSPAPAAQTFKLDSLPALEINEGDPAALIVSPTMLNMPASIMERFELARSKAPSHTAVVLDALRAHVLDLPNLILARRPGAKPGDLFPWRDAPGSGREEPSLPLRIRPTTGELAVMKALVDWSSTNLRALRAGTRATNRSEMVAAALDAYLPSSGK
jgi:hypothetical protein